MQTQVSELEWSARCELAALYRVLAHYRMTDLIDTHVSFKLLDQPNCFLINDYAVPFEQMCASDLVKINHEGEIIEHFEKHKRVNQAGFLIHAAIHQARPELNCVIHIHTVDGIAVASHVDGLLPISQHALKFYQNVGYHDYAGIVLSENEQTQLVADLRHYPVLLLRHHGLIATGQTIASAFENIYFLERACQIQTRCDLAHTPYIDATIAAYTQQQLAQDEELGITALFWQAAKRLISSDYRK